MTRRKLFGAIPAGVAALAAGRLPAAGPLRRSYEIGLTLDRRPFDDLKARIARYAEYAYRFYPTWPALGPASPFEASAVIVSPSGISAE